MPHPSYNKLNLRRVRAEAAVLTKANKHYQRAVRLEAQNKPLQARTEAVKGRTLMRRAHASGKFIDGPVGRLPNPTISGLKGEILQVDRDIADLETDPFYRETPGRKAYRAKWLSYHRRQRRQLEALLKKLENASMTRKNGIVEAAAGLQALEYIGAKAKRAGLGRKPKFNPKRIAKVDAYKVFSGYSTAYLKKILTTTPYPEIQELIARVLREREKKAVNPKRKGSRDALGVWHPEAAENPKRRTKGKRRRQVTLAFKAGRFIGTLKRKQSNPSITEVSRMFQGEANGAISKLDAPDSAPADLARIGRFVFLKLSNGYMLRIPRAMVAADTKKRLWIVGKGPLLARKAPAGERLDYGAIATICYDTTKMHDDGKRHEWVHEFGEDGGKRPRLQVDHEGMPLIVGGDYKIEARGIVD